MFSVALCLFPVALFAILDAADRPKFARPMTGAFHKILGSKLNKRYLEAEPLGPPLDYYDDEPDYYYPEDGVWIWMPSTGYVYAPVDDGLPDDEDEYIYRNLLRHG